MSHTPPVTQAPRDRGSAVRVSSGWRSWLYRPVNSRAFVVGVPGRELTTVGRRILWIRLTKARAPVCRPARSGDHRRRDGLHALCDLGPRLHPRRGRGDGRHRVLAAFGWYLLLSDASFTWGMGALGEYWTSEELRGLGRGWTVLNSLHVPGANGTPREIDHVAVGPGGVVVMQTKLRPSELRQIDASSSLTINAAAVDAHRQAVVVRLYLGDLVEDASVLSLLVLWGSGLASADKGVASNRQGVEIVHGRDLDTTGSPVAAAGQDRDRTNRYCPGAVSRPEAAFERHEAAGRLETPHIAMMAPSWPPATNDQAGESVQSMGRRSFHSMGRHYFVHGPRRSAGYFALLRGKVGRHDPSGNRE